MTDEQQRDRQNDHETKQAEWESRLRESNNKQQVRRQNITGIVINSVEKKAFIVRVAMIMSALLIIPTLTLAQLNLIIGPDGEPLPLRPGMTLAQAVQALRPEHQRYILGGDSGWALQIFENAPSDKVLISLWSDECQDYVINYDAKLSVLLIHSPEYHTREGVHVGMLLKDVEKKLGKLKEIYTSEPTFEQHAVFTRMPEGISFRTMGGIFKDGERRTQRYAPDAQITMIEVYLW
jgi:hypothetical protein